MGAETSKSGNSPPESECSPNVIHAENKFPVWSTLQTTISAENELPLESSLQTINNLPETDPNSCVFETDQTHIKRANSVLNVDLGVLTIEQLNHSEKDEPDSSVCANVKERFTTTIDVKEAEMNLSQSHSHSKSQSNTPLLNVDSLPNLPICFDNCPAQSLNPDEIKTESSILFGDKTLSSSPVFIDTSLPHSPVMIDTLSNSLLSLDINQFMKPMDDDCKAVQSSCAGDVCKSADKDELVDNASAFNSRKNSTDKTCSTVERTLEDVTSNSVKTDSKDDNKSESFFLSSTFFKESDEFEKKINLMKQQRSNMSTSKFQYDELSRNMKSMKDTVVPEKLKEVEKVANRLCSFTINTSKIGLNKNAQPPHQVLLPPHQVLLPPNQVFLPPQTCLPSHQVLLPQPAQVYVDQSIILQIIVNDLKRMNKFISDLKSSWFVSDKNVLISLKSLKSTISSLIYDGCNDSDNDRDSAFKLLLESLPDHYQKHKYIATFEKGVPFCKLCKQYLSLNILNEIEHLEGKSHKKLSSDFEEKQQCTNLPSICKNENGINVTLFHKENDVSNHNDPNLENNHNGILNIIFESKINNFDINYPFYLCISCDFMVNDDKIANIHLTDKFHKVQSNADWSFCSSCGLNIYGTAYQFKAHCSSLMHINILKLNGESNQSRTKTDKEIETCSPKGEENSGSSSSSSLSSKVESKPCPTDKDSSNKESEESSEETSQETESIFQPKIDLIQEEKINNLVFLKDGACIIEEMDDKEDGSDSGDESSDVNLAFASDSSCSEGPHYDLMKAVFKKHLLNEPKTDYFGFYCNVCRASSIDEKLWLTHLARVAHCNRMDSPGFAGKITIHDCDSCHIQMICDKDFYSWHKQTIPHKVIISSVNDRTNPEFQSNQGTPKVNDIATTEAKFLVKNGVCLKGLPSDFKDIDVVKYFKQYGYLKSCVIDKKSGECQIEFAKRINATMLLERKYFDIKSFKVEATPLYANNQKSAKKKVKPPSKLTYKAKEVLMTKKALEAKVTGLMMELGKERKRRLHQGQLIERDLYRLMPNCKVHFFGSFITGLASQESDFDIYIEFDKGSFFKDMPIGEQTFHLERLRHLLQVPSSSFRVKETALGARVPIIRAQHKETDTPCDISCRNGLSVENSRLIGLYLNSDMRVLQLVAIIKWWMRENNLLGSNMFTSYATVWLVFFYLMNLPKPVLCSVAKLQTRCKPYSVASWDCRFSREIEKCFKTENQQTLPQLLVQFFNFYKDYSFYNVVLCPLTATAINRQKFVDLDLPPFFNPYLYKMQNDRHAEALKINNPICVQDPFDLSHNITKGIFGSELKKFKQLCELSELVLLKGGN